MRAKAVHDDEAPIVGAARERGDDRTRRRRRRAAHDREVFLLRAAGDGVALHAGMHTGAERDEDEARRIPVEARDDARLVVAGE